MQKQLYIIIDESANFILKSYPNRFKFCIEINFILDVITNALNVFLIGIVKF